MKKTLFLVLFASTLLLTACKFEFDYNPDTKVIKTNVEVDEDTKKIFNDKVKQFGEENLTYDNIKNLISIVNDINTDKDSISKVDIFYDGVDEDYMSSAQKYDIEYIYDKATNIINTIRIYSKNN